MIKRIAYAVGVSLLLPAAIILLILAASGGLAWFQPQGDAQVAAQEKDKEQKQQQQTEAPLGVWSDLPNFPNVSLGFSNDPNANGPLRLKRAGAAAYHPNGKIYILGGRHRIDGDDIGSRWIWEYTPGNPGTLAQKAALLDANNYGSRFVANMAVATLTDTNGVRIYAIGGSSPDSVAANTVRVYDPNSDTLTTSDPWPANPARIPGGWAVHNNKLYIFGGFSAHANNGQGAVYADTWRFDPMAPSGSKWTQLSSANLGTARNGIAGATLNGYVYAIGGNVTTGGPTGTVSPVAVVERMNPADSNPTWQPVASLPYPRGDMGAWAYDTGTGYEISGRILVAGGGYPVPDAQAYLYDPAANSWVFFTEMLRPRRNYAYAQMNGMLYAFGGYNVTVNGYWGLFDGDNDSQRYNASGPPPPSIVTPTSTPSPTPTSPLANVPYTYTITTGATVVPGTTLIPGSNCVQCLSMITLPFPFTYYGTTFTQAMASTSGNLQFMSNATWWVNNCLPDPAFRYAMLPYWDNLSQTGAGSGVYTSVSGSAPNRIFNIEWRAGASTNFEIRLYEGTNQFEYVYGTIPQIPTPGTATPTPIAAFVTIGSQLDAGNFTQVECSLPQVIFSGSKITWSQGPVGTATPTVTGTPPTATATRSPTNTVPATSTPSPTNTVPVPEGCNPTTITIPNSGPASPYPSNINYGDGGTVTDVNVQLNGLTHTYPDDIDILLVGPGGQSVVLMSDAGGGGDVTGINLTFDDEAATTIPDSAQLVTGSYKPFNWPIADTWPAPAPAPPYGATLSEFDGTNPNGTWSLYVVDDAAGDAGMIAGGWCLIVTTGGTTPTPVPPTATRTPTTAPSATSTSPPQPTNTPMPGTPTYPPATATYPPATYTPTALPATHTPTAPPATATSTQPVPSVTAPPATATSAPPATETATSTAVPTGTPGPSPTACALEFADVPPGHTFYPFVRCLACQGIISGYVCGEPGEPCNGTGDPYFRPFNPVTRGQIAKIVSESAGFEDSVPTDRQTFADVPYGSTFWEWVERMSMHDVMQGYACASSPNEPCDDQDRPYFRPDNGATRSQLVKLMTNAAEWYDDVAPDVQTFADVPYGHPFWLYIERYLLHRPIGISGYPCGGPNEPCDPQGRPYFRPFSDVTRGQTSKIVADTFFPGCDAPGR